MLKKDIIINSIVFKSEMDRGVSQIDLLDKLVTLGFKRFEVRREFLSDTLEELLLLREKSERLDVKLFYSVNEELLVEGDLNPRLKQLLQEAQILGAPFLKLNIGDAEYLTLEILDSISDYLPDGMKIIVENNQDLKGGSLSNCLQFMTIASQSDLPFYFVLDIANWAFVGESVIESVEKMSQSTIYLHCKNYHQTDMDLKVSSSLFDGEINIVGLLKKFPTIEYVALEYETDEETLISDATYLMNAINNCE